LLPSPTCPWTPNKNDIDEVVYITDDPRITGTLATKFETYWTDTSRQLQGYANVSPPYLRFYPVVTHA
jgi:hypothetical protein